MARRYLRQLKTGRIYNYTPTLAKRADMTEIDLESANTRIEALKAQMAQATVSPEQVAKRKEEAAKLTQVSGEIARLEKEAEEARAAQVEKAEAELLGEQAPKPNDLVKPKEHMTKEMEEEDRKSKILANDDEYNKILAMREKKEVLDYLAAGYGITEDVKKTLQVLKNIALEKRSERVFER